MTRLPPCTRSCCSPADNVLDTSRIPDDRYVTDKAFNYPDTSTDTESCETIDDLIDDTTSSSSSSEYTISDFLNWEDAISPGILDTAFNVGPSDSSSTEYKHLYQRFCFPCVSPQTSDNNFMTTQYASIRQTDNRSKQSGKSRVRRLLSRFRNSSAKFFPRK